MKTSVLRTALVLLLFPVGAPLSAQAEPAPVPPAPYYYVLDEPKALSPKMVEALQTLLVEHDRVTGEQFFVAVFETAGDEDPLERTRHVFEQWKIGKRGKDNGLLLTLFKKEEQARLVVGYGLEPVLPEARVQQILSEVFEQEFRADRPDRAIGLTVHEVLHTLGSPLIQSGQAEKLLRRGGIHTGLLPTDTHPILLALGLGLGILLAGAVLYFVTSAEAHFTATGWIHPRPWDLRRGRGSLSSAGIGGSIGQW